MGTQYQQRCERRPLILDAWVVSRLRHGESWVALPLWLLAIVLLAVPKLGFLLVVPVLFAFFALVSLGGTRTERRDIEVTPEGVRIGRSFVPRTVIRRGERTSPQRYSVEDGWRRVREIVVLESAADELERLLHFDSRVPVTSFTVGAFPLYDYKLLLFSVAIASGFSALMGELPASLAELIAIPTVVLFSIPGRVEFGPDGADLRWLFTRRFVPIRNCADVRLEGDVVFVDLKDGSSVALPTIFNRRVAREIAARFKR
jgi:hypothetical protein